MTDAELREKAKRLLWSTCCHAPPVEANRCYLCIESALRDAVAEERRRICAKHQNAIGDWCPYCTLIDSINEAVAAERQRWEPLLEVAARHRPCWEEDPTQSGRWCEECGDHYPCQTAAALAAIEEKNK